MTHVALIIPGLDRIAGAERQVLLLASGLAARKWRVSVVALSGHAAEVAPLLRESGVQFFSLEMRKGLCDPRGWMRYRRWFRREAPAVIHAHLPHAAWLARWSRLAAPVPVLIDSIHTSATGGLGSRLGYRLSKWLPDRVSAVSESVAQAYACSDMVVPRRLVVIPNGVDVDRWRPAPATRPDLRTRLGYGDKFLWLAAGRLNPVKDYPTLLWAMTELPAAAHLVIAGAGPEERALRQLAVQFSIRSRVRFLGFQPDVLPWMRAADALVLPSLWEGLPMSLLEAGACALPAVATDVPGSREVIVNGETGLLATPANSPALRGAMHRMMCLDARARAAMGQKARSRIVELFSLDRVLDRWEALYRELLESQKYPVGSQNYPFPAVHS